MGNDLAPTLAAIALVYGVVLAYVAVRAAFRLARESLSRPGQSQATLVRHRPPPSTIASVLPEVGETASEPAAEPQASVVEEASVEERLMARRAVRRAARARAQAETPAPLDRPATERSAQPKTRPRPAQLRMRVAQRRRAAALATGIDKDLQETG